MLTKLSWLQFLRDLIRSESASVSFPTYFSGMSRKRKAEQDLPAGKSKRNGHQLEVEPSKSARSAFAARPPPPAEPPRAESTELETLLDRKDGSQSMLEIATQVKIATKVSMPATRRTVAQQKQIQARPGPTSQTELEEVDSSDGDDDEDANNSSDHSNTPNANTTILTEAQYPRTWKRAREILVNEILSQPRSGKRIQIIGSVNTGKVTFTKYLINSLMKPPEELGLTPLKSVAVMHLDPTKPEFGLPGHVTMLKIDPLLQSLDAFGSGKSYPAFHEQTLRSIPVGVYGQKEDATLFLSAVEELLQVFHELHSPMPLLIYCPSFERESEQGMDHRTSQRLIRLLDAEHIFSLAHRTAHIAEAVEMVRKAKEGGTIWELEALAESRGLSPFAAEDVRDVALQYYFHPQTLGIGSTSREGLTMRQRKPYALSYLVGDVGHDQHICGVFVLGDLPPNHPLMIRRILNGAVVGLLIFGGHHGGNIISTSEEDRIPYFTHQNGGNPDPSVLLQGNSIGLGLIRDIDHERGIMHIITPKQVAEKLHDVPAQNVMLVHGVAASPRWAYREDLEAGIAPCYLGKTRKGMQTVKSRRFKKQN
jgi:hypothetical protein